MATPLLNKNNFKPQTTICSVKYESQTHKVESSGTGIIYKLEFSSGIWRTIFVTCFQALPINCSNQIIGLTLNFEDKSIGKLKPTPDWVRTFCKSRVHELDVTFMDLSTNAIDVLSRSRINFLQYAAPQENNQQVIYFEYCVRFSTLSKLQGDEEFCVGFVTIQNISNEIIEFTTNAETIMVGSPLLQLIDGKYNVIGICKNSSHNNVHIAIRMDKIFKTFEVEITKQLDKLTSDEYCLGLINQNSSTRKLIGCGSYGKVFRQMGQPPEQNVIALKVVDEFGVIDSYKSEKQALEKEYQVVKSLDNNRIIKFFNFVKDVQNARFIIVMEYLDGGTLLNKINSVQSTGKTMLDKSKSLIYLIQILEGVNFLHQQNIYHNDIKPANILFTTDGQIKLCDFGSAVQDTTETFSTVSNGKVDYYFMSPERANGLSGSAATDIWSVGVTFVTMVSGNPINHKENLPLLIVNITQYIISIDEIPLDKYIETLNEDDYRKEIIKNTLCEVTKRFDAPKLLHLCNSLSLDSSNIFLNK